MLTNNEWFNCNTDQGSALNNKVNNANWRHLGYVNNVKLRKLELSKLTALMIVLSLISILHSLLL